MSHAVLDDHLLRDLLSDESNSELDNLLADFEPATTNMYLVRLYRSVVSSRGRSLTGAWPQEARQELARQLLSLPEHIEVVPMRTLAFRMAELAGVRRRLSTLGAEAVAAAEYLDAPLCVWAGNDGDQIRGAMDELNGDYRTLSR